MDQQPEDAWFYSKGSSRHGPVTLEELQRRIDAAEVDASKDMVWQKGMTSWKPIREMQGVFRIPIAPTQPSSPPAQPSPPPRHFNPPSPDKSPTPGPVIGHPTSTSQPPSRGHSADWPGARRRSYLFAVIVLPVLWMILFPVATAGLASFLGQNITGLFGTLGMLVPIVLIIAYKLQRLSNLGMSRWWFLAGLVPVLNLWIDYRCIACPAGYAVHKKMDGVGIMLAILYWLLVLVMVASIAGMCILSFMLMTDSGFQNQLIDSLSEHPELQQQVREAIGQMKQGAPAP